MRHTLPLLLCALLAACGGKSPPAPAAPAPAPGPATPAAADPAPDSEELEASEEGAADAARARAQYDAARRKQGGAAEPGKGQPVSKYCLENPLAKGCPERP